MIEAQTCFNLILERAEKWIGEPRATSVLAGFFVFLCALGSLLVFSFAQMVEASVFCMYLALTVVFVLGLVCFSQSKKINSELVPDGST